MYYRFEACKAQESSEKKNSWVGIFSVLNPSQRRFIGRTLAEPKWYEKNLNIESKCWFTEKGYEKYKDVLEGMIEEYLLYHPNAKFRVVKKDNLENYAVKGSIQCIEIVET